MNRVVIKASEVAAVIGRNPYKSATEVRDEMWKRYWPETFRGETRGERSWKAVRSSGNATKVLDEAVAIQTKSSTETENVFLNAKASIEADQTLTTVEKADVIDHIRSKVYTNHGIRSEDKTSDALEGVFKKDNAFHMFHVCDIENYDFTIVGKIDRIQEMPDGSKVLIEIKNRTKRLFNKIPEYEYVQVQTYLQMLNLERGRLVEQYNDTIASHDVVRDDEYWKSVLVALESFCRELIERVE